VTIANQEQADHWNSEEASHWVTHQAAYDRMLAPFSDMVLAAAALRPRDRVLDVGCGCGATTCAAAQVQLFGESSFDAVISRFGIMFFADSVAAFANLRHATRPGDRMAFACWQDLTANQWLLVPGAAIAQHVPLPDLGGPGAPGMFAFADPRRIRTVLAGAGWHHIDIEPMRTPILVGGGGGMDETVEFLRTGSMGRTLLGGIDTQTSARAVLAVRDALAPYRGDHGVRLEAAVWRVLATR